MMQQAAPVRQAAGRQSRFAPASSRAAARVPGGGVSLRMKDKHDDSDGEFERY
jgi:hypothetical protein